MPHAWLEPATSAYAAQPITHLTNLQKMPKNGAHLPDTRKKKRPRNRCRARSGILLTPRIYGTPDRRKINKVKRILKDN